MVNGYRRFLGNLSVCIGSRWESRAKPRTTVGTVLLVVGSHLFSWMLLGISAKSGGNRLQFLFLWVPAVPAGACGMAINGGRRYPWELKGKGVITFFPWLMQLRTMTAGAFALQLLRDPTQSAAPLRKAFHNVKVFYAVVFDIACNRGCHAIRYN